MGASESTSRSNRTNEEEERQQENNSSMTTATAVATAAAGAAVAVWGISKMLSNNTEETEESNRQVMVPSLLNTPRMEAAGYKQRSIWSPPPPGRFKLNTDGACRPIQNLSQDGVQRGPSGYGGILRDHHGKWVRGFIGFIGVSDCLTSELHGILKGLELLDQLQIKQAYFETDSQAACEWVTREDDYRGKSAIVDACWSIIKKCRHLIHKNDVEISLIQGENANQCADKLANIAIERREVYADLKDCHYELRSLVEKDAN